MDDNKRITSTIGATFLELNDHTLNVAETDTEIEFNQVTDESMDEQTLGI